MFRDLRNLVKQVNREANITDTWREDGRWDRLSLVLIYNGIIYMFGFDVADGGTGEG